MATATAFLSALSGLCTQTVGVRAKSSRNNYGEPVYSGSATSYSAYVQRVNSSNADVERDDSVAEWVAYIPSSTLTISIDDEVEYPSSVIRPVVKVDYRYDEHGQQFVIVSIGKG
ncbi:MAG: hypothetical protein ACO3VQ_02430 [Ilumatobacteraceae bacterium]